MKASLFRLYGLRLAEGEAMELRLIACPVLPGALAAFDLPDLGLRVAARPPVVMGRDERLLPLAGVEAWADFGEIMEAGKQ
jgi:hypothetical protein